MFHYRYRDNYKKSRKKAKNFSEGTLAPLPRYPNVVKFLTKIWELHGENDSEIARKLKVDQVSVGYWRKGDHAPSKGALHNISVTFNVPVEYLTGVAGVTYDPPADYRKPDARERKIMADLDELLKSGDEEILDNLKRQVAMLVDLHKRRKQQP